jgi:hypothetical protein
MTQDREDPPLRDLYTDFDFGFGVSRALHPVMRISHTFSQSRIRSIHCMARRLSS